MMSAHDAFEASILTVEMVAGGACLLIFAICLVVAAVLIAKSRKQDDQE